MISISLIQIQEKLVSSWINPRVFDDTRGGTYTVLEATVEITVNQSKSDFYFLTWNHCTLALALPWAPSQPSAQLYSSSRDTDSESHRIRPHSHLKYGQWQYIYGRGCKPVASCRSHAECLFGGSCPCSRRKDTCIRIFKRTARKYTCWRSLSFESIGSQKSTASNLVLDHGTLWTEAFWESFVCWADNEFRDTKSCYWSQRAAHVHSRPPRIGTPSTFWHSGGFLARICR